MQRHLLAAILLFALISCRHENKGHLVTFNLDVSEIADQIKDPASLAIGGSLNPLSFGAPTPLKPMGYNIYSAVININPGQSDTLHYRFVRDTIYYENWEMGMGADRTLILSAPTIETHDKWGEVTLVTGRAKPAPLLRVLNTNTPQERGALAEPFKGVTADGNVETGLYSVSATGVSTEPVRNAVNAFLAALSEEQRASCMFPIESHEWRRWSNIDASAYKRSGIGLDVLDAKQKELAHQILKASLSVQGYQKTQDIMKMEQYLGEFARKPESIGKDKYWFIFLGEPSATEPWGWQIDGHHLVINYFILGDQVVMTPTFMGSEPTRIPDGPDAGFRTFQDEQNLGLAVFQSLSPDQKKLAMLWDKKDYGYNQGESYRDNAVVPYDGIKYTDLNPEQQQKLHGLAAQYVNNIHEGHSDVKMAEVDAHLDRTYFAWVGADSDTSAFYYRIHSPVILIEFDHQRPIFMEGKKPSRNHIHTVVRTPNGNDYGKDLLRQHLEERHANQNQK